MKSQYEQDHVDMYYSIVNHQVLSKYHQASIELSPHFVDPRTGQVDCFNKENNTQFEWWAEVSYCPECTENEEINTAYIKTIGNTAENAIKKLYTAVVEVYGE